MSYYNVARLLYPNNRAIHDNIDNVMNIALSDYISDMRHISTRPDRYIIDLFRDMVVDEVIYDDLKIAADYMLKASYKADTSTNAVDIIVTAKKPNTYVLDRCAIEKIQEQGVVEMKKLDTLKERETLYFDILCAFNRPDAEKRYRLYIDTQPDDMRKEDYFNSIIKYGIVIGWNESIDEDTLDRIYYLCDKYNWVRDSVIKPKED